MTDAGKAVAASDEGLRSLLEGGLHELGLDVDGRRVASLLAFADLLLRWNRTYNLTAIRTPRDVVTHHLLDCLAIIPALERQLSRTCGRRVLDVGSGAGLPGLVIAIVDPEAQVVCVDSVGKKAAFITQAIASLGLENVEAVHGRVELLQRPAFDVIVSRAFSSLTDLVSATERLLSPDGVWMAMKGRVPAAELQGLGASCMVHVEPIRVPEVHAERCMVLITRHSESRCEHTPTGRSRVGLEKNPS